MRLTMMSITDLLKNKNKTITVSLEITPDIKFGFLYELKFEPTFFSVTWHAKSHRCVNLDIAPLKMATHLKINGNNVLLHLTCDLLRRKYLDDLLSFLQENCIMNLLVMLGEGYDPASSDFANSKALIQHIRKQCGDYFTIGVVGFLDCSDMRLSLLKEKIDEGANFIITQAFFEPQAYKSFTERCRQIGITVPILPGIFLCETMKELTSFATLCNVKVPDDFLQNLAACEEDKLSCKVFLNTLTGKNNSNERLSTHLHIFTLNKIARVNAFLEQTVL